MSAPERPSQTPIEARRYKVRTTVSDLLGNHPAAPRYIREAWKIGPTTKRLHDESRDAILTAVEVAVLPENIAELQQQVEEHIKNKWMPLDPVYPSEKQRKDTILGLMTQMRSLDTVYNSALEARQGDEALALFDDPERGALWDTKRFVVGKLAMLELLCNPKAKTEKDRLRIVNMFATEGLMLFKMTAKS